MSKKKKQTIKKKGLFDHLNAVTQYQNPDYWDTLSTEDKKTYSDYMVNRFLSMKMEWVDFVNDVQKYWDVLTPREHYKIYCDVLPKGKQFLKYVKGKNDMNLPKWFIEIMTKHYECSISEVSNAVETLILTEQGMYEIREVLQKYGIEPKMWKELPFSLQ